MAVSELSVKDVRLSQRTIFNMTHQSIDPDQLRRIEELRNAAKRMVGIIYSVCELSRERSQALTSLEESLSHAVAAIAREGWDTEDAPTG